MDHPQPGQQPSSPTPNPHPSTPATPAPTPPGSPAPAQPGSAQPGPVAAAARSLPYVAPSTPPPPAPPRSSSAAVKSKDTPKESIKDTLISIVIAFVVAFVFRGFVVEAFVIPTGSMAPTLMGAHMRFRAEQSGYTWPVGPWFATPQNTSNYDPIQGSPGSRHPFPVVVHDPMTGERRQRENVRLLSGDRILVLKFLAGVFQPERYDVVVFKDPTNPAVNFIKRLVGLPGEQIALVDGDVFVRPSPQTGLQMMAAAAEARVRERSGSVVADEASWAESGWRIARKPARVQRDVWQPVFDSRYAPLNPQLDGRAWYNPPWRTAGDERTGGGGWDIAGQIYTYRGDAPTALVYEPTRVRYVETRTWAAAGSRTPWTIDDRYPYNESPLGPQDHFPVSDVRMRMGVEPERGLGELRATLAARGHEFEAVLTPGADGGAGGTVTLRMRPTDAEVGQQPTREWTVLATAELPRRALAAGRVTDVEFWHVDQTVQFWVDGRRIAAAEYDWSPAERIRNATGHPIATLLDSEASGRENVFAKPDIYRRPGFAWSFAGGPVRLHRVGIDRDLHYRAAMRAGVSGPPGLGTHPAYSPSLNDEQYFVLGDNSPASLDGRLWGDSNRWVELIDPTPGIVHRKLMIGRAFFVYFPSLHWEESIPVPDFGRLRFIW